MAVDRSYGASVLIGVLTALVMALVPYYVRDIPVLIGAESTLWLALWMAVIIRQKSIRERCVVCGSDVETHFLATAIPPPEHPDSPFRRPDGPVCRVCTDLEGDRALRYPIFTRFDDNKNPIRRCDKCARMMRESFLDHFSFAIGNEGALLKHTWACKFPQSRACAKLAKKLPAKAHGPEQH